MLMPGKTTKLLMQAMGRCKDTTAIPGPRGNYQPTLTLFILLHFTLHMSTIHQLVGDTAAAAIAGKKTTRTHANLACQLG